MQETDDVELDLEPDHDPQPELESRAAPEDEIDPATQAFAQLERQMALMRHAVEHLSAERTDTVVPDYNATLGRISGDLAKVTQAVAQIAAEPALKHTPQTMAERIAQAAETARRSDHERLLQAQIELGTAGEDLRRMVGTIRTAAEQRQRTIKVAGVGVLIGVLLWAGLAGPIARSLPDSWQLPERIARRALGTPTLVDAGPSSCRPPILPVGKKWSRRQRYRRTIEKRSAGAKLKRKERADRYCAKYGSAASAD